MEDFHQKLKSISFIFGCNGSPQSNVFGASEMATTSDSPPSLGERAALFFDPCIFNSQNGNDGRNLASVFMISYISSQQYIVSRHYQVCKARFRSVYHTIRQMDFSGTSTVSL